MSVAGITSSPEYPLEVGLPEQSNKRKCEGENGLPLAKRLKIDSGDKEMVTLETLPVELLGRIVQHVANGYWFSKSCQNFLSVNKSFYNEKIVEILKFDGINEGEFISDIITCQKEHSSRDILLSDETVRHCTLKIHHWRGPARFVTLFALLFPECKTLISSSCNNDDIVGLWHFKKLQKLILSDCKEMTMPGISMPFLKSVPLQWLTLRDHKNFTDEGLSMLTKQAKLRGLDLEGCEKLTAIPHSGLSELESLRLTNCKKLTPETISGLTAMTKIQKLILEDYIEPVTFDFSTSSGLQELSLYAYSELSTLTLSDLQNFQKLNIEYCSKLTSLMLSNLPKLQEVTFLSTQVLLPDLKLSKVPNVDSFSTAPGKMKIAFSRTAM